MKIRFGMILTLVCVLLAGQANAGDLLITAQGTTQNPPWASSQDTKVDFNARILEAWQSMSGSSGPMCQQIWSQMGSNIQGAGSCIRSLYQTGNTCSLDQNPAISVTSSSNNTATVTLKPNNNQLIFTTSVQGACLAARSIPNPFKPTDPTFEADLNVTAAVVFNFDGNKLSVNSATAHIAQLTLKGKNQPASAIIAMDNISGAIHSAMNKIVNQPLDFAGGLGPSITQMNRAMASAKQKVPAAPAQAKAQAQQPDLSDILDESPFIRALLSAKSSPTTPFIRKVPTTTVRQILAPQARVKSNTQVALPENLFLGDMNGDGIDEFIQVSGTWGAGNHNRILIFGTDANSTGMLHLYLDSDVEKVFTGNFLSSNEPDYGPDQLCVTTASGQLSCYMTKDQATLSLMWSQKNFIQPGEDVIVGDFSGAGRDEILLYNSSAGTFRMATRISGSASASPAFSLILLAPGDLGSGQLVNYQLRAGQWAGTPGPDGLIAYNPSDGQVMLFQLGRQLIGGAGRPSGIVSAFKRAFTASTASSSTRGSYETLSTGRLADGPTDSLVLRNTSNGAYRFFTPTSSGLTSVAGVVPGQLPVTSVAGGPLVFVRLSGLGGLRDDALFFNAKPGQFSSIGAAYDSNKNEQTYWWGFDAPISTRDVGWPPVQHDKWLFLRCKFADYPNLVDPLWDPDTYIQNEFGRNGIGMGGFVDFFREITYGKIDYNIDLAPGWYPTVPTNKYSRFAANSTCAINYGHGITSASFRGGSYVGPTYAGIITLWNKQHDAGNDGGNLTVLDSGIVGTDMAGAAHEALHAYGLAHPYADLLIPLCQKYVYGNDNTVYCDIWDPMGGSQHFNPKISTYHLPANNPGMPAKVLPPHVLDGTELNGPNRLQLNAIPPDRILVLRPLVDNPGQQRATVTLAALEKPEANGYLLIKIPQYDPLWQSSDDQSFGSDDQFITVAFRVPTGWDRNINQSAVIIHEVFTFGHPPYVPGQPPASWWMEYFKSHPLKQEPKNMDDALLAGEFVPGDPTASYGPNSVRWDSGVEMEVWDRSNPVNITVQSFNLAASTATVLVEY